MKNLVFKGRGAAHVGKSPHLAWRVRYPLAKIELYEDCLFIKIFPFIRVESPLKEILRADLIRGGGVRFYLEQRKNIYLVFWPIKNLRALVHALESLGIEVAYGENFST